MPNNGELGTNTMPGKAAKSSLQDSRSKSKPKTETDLKPTRAAKPGNPGHSKPKTETELKATPTRSVKKPQPLRSKPRSKWVSGHYGGKSETESEPDTEGEAEFYEETAREPVSRTRAGRMSHSVRRLIVTNPEVQRKNAADNEEFRRVFGEETSNDEETGSEYEPSESGSESEFRVSRGEKEELRRELEELAHDSKRAGKGIRDKGRRLNV